MSCDLVRAGVTYNYDIFRSAHETSVQVLAISSRDSECLPGLSFVAADGKERNL